MPSQERIREVAYRIWREEGCPPGRDRENWEKARALVAMEEGAADATEPNPIAHPPNVGPQGEPVEQAGTLENLGEFPTLTDQGEQEPPHRVEQPPAKPRRTRTKRGG